MDFLVDRILAEAQRDGVSLSEVERKMLYFSETAWTLPDMAEVGQEFCNHYDQAEFEWKISGIIRKIQRAPLDKAEERSWHSAIGALRNKDHYLLVLINSAGSVRPRDDVMKLVLTAAAIVCAFLVMIIFFPGVSN